MESVIDRLRAALSQGPEIRLAVLFGSVAAGRERPESDVDVAILPPPAGLSHEEEGRLGRALTLAARAEVDLVDLQAASTLLKWQVATTGRPLFEAAPGEFARFRARAAAEYIDYAPAAKHHGEVFRRRLAEAGPGR